MEHKRRPTDSRMFANALPVCLGRGESVKGRAGFPAMETVSDRRADSNDNKDGELPDRIKQSTSSDNGNALHAFSQKGLQSHYDPQELWGSQMLASHTSNDGGLTNKSCFDPFFVDRTAAIGASHQSHERCDCFYESPGASTTVEECEKPPQYRAPLCCTAFNEDQPFFSCPAVNQHSSFSKHASPPTTAPRDGVSNYCLSNSSTPPSGSSASIKGFDDTRLILLKKLVAADTSTSTPIGTGSMQAAQHHPYSQQFLRSYQRLIPVPSESTTPSLSEASCYSVAALASAVVDSSNSLNLEVRSDEDAQASSSSPLLSPFTLPCSSLLFNSSPTSPVSFLLRSPKSSPLMSSDEMSRRCQLIPSHLLPSYAESSAAPTAMKSQTMSRFSSPSSASIGYYPANEHASFFTSGENEG